MTDQHWLTGFLLVFLANVLEGSEFLKLGGCPMVSPVHIHPRDFVGRWYEAKRDHESGSYEDTTDCIFFDISFGDHGYGWHLIMNTSIYNGLFYENTTIKAKQPFYLDTTSDASFVMELPKSEQDQTFIKDKVYHRPVPNFFVLSIDDQVALFYYCQEKMGYFKDERAWIMSRDPTPDYYRVFDMEEVLKQNGITLFMEDVNIEKCSLLNDKPWEETLQ